MIKNLQKVSSTLPGTDRKRQSPASAVTSLFKRKSGSAKKGKGRYSQWTHKFVCLSRCSQSIIPTTPQEKSQLYVAGLGEKRLTINLDATPEEFKETLIEAFPKMSRQRWWIPDLQVHAKLPSASSLALPIQFYS